MSQGKRTPIPRPKGGKPTKCSDAVITAVADYVSSGGYPTPALESLGIVGQCHNQWLNNAQRDYDQGLTRHESLFITYAEEIGKAVAKWEQTMITRVSDASAAGPQYWAAAMTALERRHPERWARRERQDTTRQTTVQIAFVPFEPPKVRVIEERKEIDAT